jgi:glycosyltransferase involved in cell wall biosynthesis
MFQPAALAQRGLLKRLAFRTIERRNLGRADALHATSAAEAASLRAAGFNQHVKVIPNGVEPDDVAAGPPGDVRRRHNIAADAPLIVFLGRLAPIKRLDMLAAAFSRVLQRCPKARLVVAGPNENGHRQTAEPWFDECRGAVTWTGPVDAVERQALLTDADVLVQCSDSESFGMSIVEAMAAGCPVVVTKTCPWEKIELHECGFWVAQTSIEIADALLAIVTNRPLGKAMGQRARKLVEQEFTWDSVAQRTHEAYLRVV